MPNPVVLYGKSASKATQTHSPFLFGTSVLTVPIPDQNLSTLHRQSQPTRLPPLEQN